MENKKLEKRNALAWFFAVGGMIIVGINLFQPPQGQIDTSVLTFFGEIAILVGALLGIDVIYAKKINEIIKELKDDSKKDKP